MKVLSILGRRSSVVRVLILVWWIILLPLGLIILCLFIRRAVIVLFMQVVLSCWRLTGLLWTAVLSSVLRMLRCLRRVI